MRFGLGNGMSHVIRLKSKAQMGLDITSLYINLGLDIIGLYNLFFFLGIISKEVCVCVCVERERERERVWLLLLLKKLTLCILKSNYQIVCLLYS